MSKKFFISSIVVAIVLICIIVFSVVFTQLSFIHNTDVYNECYDKIAQNDYLVFIDGVEVSVDTIYLERYPTANIKIDDNLHYIIIATAYA